MSNNDTVVFKFSIPEDAQHLLLVAIKNSDVPLGKNAVTLCTVSNPQLLTHPILIA